MAGRVQVDAPRGNAQLGVYAQPVNTSVIAKQPDKNTELEQLARALQDIQPSINQAIDSEYARADKRDSQQAINDLVSGVDPQQDASHTYLRVYQEQKGRVTGLNEFNQELMNAYENSGLTGSDDPQAFKDFSAKFQQDYMTRHKDANPDFMSGLTPVVQQSMQNLSMHHGSVLAQNVMNGHIQNYQDELTTAIRSMHAAGSSPEEIGAVVNQINDRFLPVFGGTKINELATGAIAETAMSLDSTDALAVMDYVKGGSAPLSKTRNAMVAIERAADQIHSKQVQKDNEEYQLHQRQKQERQDEGMTAITDAIINDPGHVPMELVRKYSDVPGLFDHALSLHGAVNREAQRASPEDTAYAWQTFLANPSNETLNDLIKRGYFKDPSDVKQAAGMAVKASADDGYKQGLSDTSFRDARSLVEKALTEDGNLKSEASTYMNLMDREYLTWLGSEDYQKATPMQRLLKIQEIQTTVLQAAGVIDGKSPQPQQPQQQQQQQAAPGLVPGISTEADLNRMLQELRTPGTKNPLTEAIQQQKIDTPEKMKQFLDSQKELLRVKQEKTQAQGNTFGGNLGGLLDIIAGGESGGKYNIINGAPSGDQPELTSMTIAQVLDYQRNWLNQGHDSTAAGRYQFVHKTLKGLVQKHSIPMDETFSPGMQDALAILLMADSGLDSYLKGRIDSNQFAYKLATQWAALPKDASGRGVYDGYKGNRAGIKWGPYLRQVQALRNYS